MSKLNITFSNRIEVLSDKMVDLLKTPLKDENFLQPEYVLVDNTTLKQWINIQLAQKHKVAANIDYIQPAPLFWKLAKALLPDVPQSEPLTKDEMTWRLFTLLGDEKVIKSMSQVANYLDGEHNKALKRYQLAASIADLFDQYLVYRPEWLKGWQQNPSKMFGTSEHEKWQAALWQKLTDTKDKKTLMHRAETESQLLEKLRNEKTLKLDIDRLFVFGITAMAPSMLRLLQLLGRHIDVHLYLLNPCQEFWFDCKAPKEWLNNKKHKIDSDNPLVIGNPLLASNGQQVRELIEQIVNEEGDDYQINDDDYESPGTDTLLHCIQEDIFNLTHGGEIASLKPDEGIKQPRDVPEIEFDLDKVPSIHIHSCHSPMREVEVLRDQLLDMFTKNLHLKPRDIVVMMPRVGDYRAMIDAVFSHTNKEQDLPYHITDLSLEEESPFLNSIDVMMGLPDSRLPLSEVLSLLEVTAIQKKFSLDRNGYEKLKSLLVESGARWGINAEQRENLGLPTYDEFSWEFAINRLLSGFAMTAEGSSGEPNLVHMQGNNASSVLPLDEVEGSSAALLNSFLLFWEKLTNLREKLKNPRNLKEWFEFINEIIKIFYEIGEEETRAIVELRKRLEILQKAGEGEWCKEEIECDVVRGFIKTVLKGVNSKGHQWREGIKFCSLMPMRGVPFKLVYMLGMNQGDYPGRVELKSFDLMQKEHRKGDRSRRVDDRWLFLEAILSARDALHISYVGHNERKNDERQPSVLVAELLDYLRDGYKYVTDADDKYGIAKYITQHPLHPFSHEYFLQEKMQPRLISYNEQAYKIAQKPESVVERSNDLWSKSGIPNDTIEVDVEEFVSFFAEPEKWFFKKNHGVYLELEDTSVSDEELFKIDALEKWQIRDAVKSVSVIDKDNLIDSMAKQRSAQAKWPIGVAGEELVDELKGKITKEWLDVAQKMQNKVCITIDQLFTTTKGNLKITGNIDTYDNQYIEHSASQESEKYLLKFYIRAALAFAANPNVHQASIHFYSDKKGVESIPIDFRSPKIDHTLILDTLVKYYLLYHEHGLPFSPKLSKTIYEKNQKDELEDEDIDNAWRGGSYTSDGGLVKNIYSRSYYMNVDRLHADSFKSVSEDICEKLWWLLDAKTRESNI